MDSSASQELTTDSHRPRDPVGPGFRVLIILYYTLALWPLIILAAVYTLSWRAASFIGHWPRPSLDDPKFIVPVSDWFYDTLYPAIWYSFGGLTLALVLLVPLALVLRRKMSLFKIILLAGVFVAGFLLLRMDPGSRLYWFFD
jgi:hypothetical protein